MKKILLLLIAFPVITFARGYNENNDTTIVINKPEQVTVNQDNSKLSIEVKGNNGNTDYYYKTEMRSSEDAFFSSEESFDDWNFKVPFLKNKKDRNHRCHYDSPSLGNFGVGLVNAVSAAPGVDVDMAASYEFMIDHLISWEYSPWRNGSSLSIGFGFDWRNYRMTSKNMFFKDNNNIAIGAYPENADVQFSRIKVFSLTVALTYTQHIYDKVYLSLGPVINFNTHASLKTRYKIDGEKVKDTDNNVHQSPITVDLMANLRFKSVGLYFKYSPTNVLDTDYAPKFKSMSAGLTFFY